jgi:hypothetical protein
MCFSRLSFVPTRLHLSLTNIKTADEYNRFFTCMDIIVFLRGPFLKRETLTEVTGKESLLRE